jgi:hypothetical protein
MRPGLHPARIVGPSRSIVAGSFTTANGADPTKVTGVFGNGFSVARDDEGVWTVTLAQISQQIDSVVLGVAGVTETVLQVVRERQADRDASAGTFVIELLQSAALAPAGNWAAADAPACIISFIAVLRDTSATDYGLG